jgi:adenylate cyclase
MNDPGTARLQVHAAPVPARPRSHLFRKYAFLIGALISGVLTVSGAIEIYYSYLETRLALQHIQREKAASAATVIDRFVGEVEAQMRWAMHPSFAPPEEALRQRRLDYLWLLRQAPEITEVAYVDSSGREQLLMSRLAVDTVASDRDYANDPRFRTAQATGRSFSPVYFRRESEPYLSLALRGPRNDRGVTIAEVNLKFVWDLISQMDIGGAGSAYVVDSNGLLIARRDISLVLRKTDLSAQHKVVAARDAVRAGSTGFVDGTAYGLGGGEVLSSYASILPLGWLVFVESPLREAFAPLYASLIRTALLIAAGIALSIVAGLLLARHIVRPIQALQQGAGRIAAGQLDHRIAISTGDELETLADEFNQMSAKLRESYDNIERISALKRYFSPHLAEEIISSKDGEMTRSHRREISVVFCDLRNFTEFSAVSEPEEAMQVLEKYYFALGTQLRRFEATIGFFAGDGLMAFLNDPLPCPDHAARAVRMASAMQDALGALIGEWRQRGFNLGFGIGISSGYATLGQIGTEDQFHYSAIGSIVNLSSRLCDQAGDGEILVTEAVRANAGIDVAIRPCGEYTLKGFPHPVPVFLVVGSGKEATD